MDAWIYDVIRQHCSVVKVVMFWQGTKGISKQTFKSLSALLTGQRLQRYRQQPDLQNQRDNLAREVIRRVKSLQNSQGKLTPSTLKQGKQMCCLSCLHTTHTSNLSAFKSFGCHYSDQDQTFLCICLGGKKNSTLVKEKSLQSREDSSIRRAKSQQPQALIPTPHPTLQCSSESDSKNTAKKERVYFF